jgi:uncharacterized alkaline shock family protein YloU
VSSSMSWSISVAIGARRAAENAARELGKVEIAPEVVEVIGGYAAGEVEGVAHMEGGFVGGLVEKFGKKNIKKGVKVELGEHHTVVDVSIVVEYGVHIPKVASTLQEHVKTTIQDITGLEVLEVNVHVVGVKVDKTELSLVDDGVNA